MSHFLSAIDSETRDFYLFNDSGSTVGYLYIDYLEDERSVEIAYGISECCAGKGLAKVMIQLGIGELRTGYDSLVAWVAETNIASIKTVKSLGFKISPEIQYRVLAQELDSIKFVKYVRDISTL